MNTGKRKLPYALCVVAVAIVSLAFLGGCDEPTIDLAGNYSGFIGPRPTNWWQIEIVTSFPSTRFTGTTSYNMEFFMNSDVPISGAINKRNEASFRLQLSYPNNPQYYADVVVRGDDLDADGKADRLVVTRMVYWDGSTGFVGAELWNEESTAWGIDLEGEYEDGGTTESLGLNLDVKSDHTATGYLDVFPNGQYLPATVVPIEGSVSATNELSFSGEESGAPGNVYSGTLQAEDADGDGEAERLSGTITLPDGTVAAVSFDRIDPSTTYRCWMGLGSCQPFLGPAQCEFTYLGTEGNLERYDVVLTVDFLDPEAGLNPGGTLDLHQTGRNGGTVSELTQPDFSIPDDDPSRKVTVVATGASTGTIEVTALDRGLNTSYTYTFDVQVEDATGLASARSPACAAP